MSQRLLISLKENVCKDKDFYDAIYTEDGDLNCLLYDWCAYSDGFYLGPWKITIRDECLMDQFMGDFTLLKKYVPKLQSLDDVWCIFDKDKNLIHISEKEEKFNMGIISKALDSEN